MLNSIFLNSILILAAIGIVAAIILYFVAQKFKVEEDPRIDLVNDCLPGANCGACGKAGCRDMAESMVKGNTDATCPACNDEARAKIAEILGKAGNSETPKVAVVRCNGGSVNGIAAFEYEGYKSCAFANTLFAGEHVCPNSCLGYGDCSKVCKFDAIHINPYTQLPEVDESKCVACGACVINCPRQVIELRDKVKNRVFVACKNTQKALDAKQACRAACIGCGRCAKTCPVEAITVTNNLAYIDFHKCISCKKCMEVCPTGAIHSIQIKPKHQTPLKKAPLAPKTFHKGGIHPHDYKINTEAEAVYLPIPQQVCVMVNQHLGAPSQPIVKKGDKVRVGDPLTSNDAFVGSIVHSPVSGTVEKIGVSLDASMYPKPAIYINVEGDEWIESIDRSPRLVKDIQLEPQEIIQRIKEMGVVGLGGACFPTHVKLSIPPDSKVDYLLINGVECEPFLTDDYRLMMDKGAEILVGIRIVMKALGVDHAIVGIENNKPKAIENLRRLSDEYPGISIQPLKMKYPQGAEKQLIKALTGREVPSQKLPIHVGCVVVNVATCFAIYEAVQKNKPLIQRLVTITGYHVPTPTNFWTRIGTSFAFVVEHCGGLPKDTKKIISGGPMMGKAISSIDIPISKGTSSGLIIPSEHVHRGDVMPCIRCAKCVEVCPMGLEPYLLSSCVENRNFEKAEQHKVMDCIECGCCQYICPSNRYLLDNIRMGKAKVGKIIKDRNSKN